MSESREDQLGRLRAMATPGQQTWDLSPKDQAAIAMAVDAIEMQTVALEALMKTIEYLSHRADGESNELWAIVAATASSLTGENIE